MKTSKKIQSRIHSGNEHYFKKLTETNLFLIKLDLKQKFSEPSNQIT